MNAEYEMLLKKLAADILPMIDSAVKTAVGIASPVVGLVASPVIDAVDSYIMRLVGVTPPANAESASTATDDRVTALEQHVAALTVATGHSTSQVMAINKALLPPPVAAAPAVDPVADALK